MLSPDRYVLTVINGPVALSQWAYLNQAGLAEVLGKKCGLLRERRDGSGSSY